VSDEDFECFATNEWEKIAEDIRASRGNTWQVKLSNRIASLIGEEALEDLAEIGPNDYVSYTWNHGYETLEVTRENGGKSIYNGAYHPNKGYCEPEPFYEGPCKIGGYICCHCGSVIW
jgi:hypothetical protein